MPIPASNIDVVPHLIKLIHQNGGSMVCGDTYEPLADVFGLTRDERTRPHPKPKVSGKEWPNRVQWTRQRCISQINPPFIHKSVGKRGVWVLTEAGRKEAERLLRIRNIRERPTIRPVEPIAKEPERKSVPVDQAGLLSDRLKEAELINSVLEAVPLPVTSRVRWRMVQEVRQIAAEIYQNLSQ